MATELPMSIKIARGKLIEFDLGIICHEEDEIIVAYIPALDLTTHGSSLDDSIKAAREAAEIFIEELVHMGTVEQVLTELGWKKSDKADPDFPYIPPHIVACLNQPVKIECHV